METWLKAALSNGTLNDEVIMNIYFIRKNSKRRLLLGFAVVLFACSGIVGAQRDRQDNGDAKNKNEERAQKKSQEQRKEKGVRQRGETQKSSNPAPAQSTLQGESREKKESSSGNRPKPLNDRRVQQERNQAQEKSSSQLKQENQNRPRNQPQREQVKPQPPARSSLAQQKIVRYSNGQPHTIRMSDGGVVRRNVSGQVIEVRTPRGAIIRHEPNGIRRVEVVRPGNRVIVATGRNHGYIQRPLIFSNRSFVQRTYISRGVIFTRVYRPVIYRGIRVNIYTPVRYYRPAFYMWAYNPWPRPIVFTWGWGRAPWYGFYGGYFVPYPTYSSPVFWLTDFLISATLEAAYEDRIAAMATAPPPYRVVQTELTPQVKQYIADEVRRQIDMERAESQNVANYSASEVPPMFADNTRHTFVVSNALLVNSGSRQCTLSEGDVIQTLGVPPVNSPVADASVLASKPAECGKGSVVSIQIPDLQEMQNYMRETVERGLGDLQARGGQAGLPALPPDSAGTIDAPFAAEVHPDNNASQELDQAEREANEAEQNVIDQSAIVAGQPGAQPITISLGQTIDQVVAVQGQPQKIVDLGGKKIYVYPDIKVTFMDGRVADVQ